MAKLVLILLAIVWAIESNRNALASAAVDLSRQSWKCADVIQNPVEIRRELATRNLKGDHKIIKFIENCIKSVDGWRFKKSGTTLAASATSPLRQLATLDMQQNLLKNLILGRLASDYIEAVEQPQQQQPPMVMKQPNFDYIRTSDSPTITTQNFYQDSTL